MKLALIIPAGGIGSRLKSKTPKQYLLLKGKPIIIHTIEKFLNIKELNEIIIAVHPQMRNDLQKMLEDNNIDSSLIKLVDSGSSRQESVFNGLKSVKESSHVFIHDSVRPFVSEELINNLIKELKEHYAVIPAIPVKDTIKKVNDALISETPDRSFLFAAQTPQAFTLSIINRANEFVNKNNISVTDDASIVEAYGKDVKIIIGDPKNIKITDSFDLAISELLL